MAHAQASVAQVKFERQVVFYGGSFSTEAANSAARPRSASPQKLTSGANEKLVAMDHNRNSSVCYSITSSASKSIEFGMLEVQYFCSLQIHRQLEARRPLSWQIGRLYPFQDLACHDAEFWVHRIQIESIRHISPPARGKLEKNPMAGSRCLSVRSANCLS